MDAQHRKLLLALFMALHPFDQESFALNPSLSPLHASSRFSASFTLPSPLSSTHILVLL